MKYETMAFTAMAVLVFAGLVSAVMTSFNGTSADLHQLIDDRCIDANITCEVSDDGAYTIELDCIVSCPEPEPIPPVPESVSSSIEFEQYLESYTGTPEELTEDLKTLCRAGVAGTSTTFYRAYPRTRLGTHDIYGEGTMIDCRAYYRSTVVINGNTYTGWTSSTAWYVWYINDDYPTGGISIYLADDGKLVFPTE